MKLHEGVALECHTDVKVTIQIKISVSMMMEKNGKHFSYLNLSDR